MSGILRLAISGRMNDRDDFRRLVLRSEDGTAEISFRRDTDEIVCESDGAEEHIPENSVLDRVEALIQQGYTSLTCECWSGDVNIEIPSGGQDKMKIMYSQPATPAEISEAEHLIDPDEAGELLRAIEIATAEGAIKADMRRKFVQIDSFVRLVQPLLRKSSQQGKIFILDCGCGKSYLSFVMNYYLREKLRRNCHFFCIDTNPDIITKCRQIKAELGYSNMDFSVSEIKDYRPHEKVDIVCSLHACDTATDEAIARGILMKAPFLLVVPCCQHEVINQLTDHPLKAITRHGVYKARLADLLTDAMRTLLLEAAGYKVSVTEYVSPINTPKNIMIQAEKIQESNKMAMEQYLGLKTAFGNMSLELEKMLAEKTGLTIIDN